MVLKEQTMLLLRTLWTDRLTFSAFVYWLRLLLMWVEAWPSRTQMMSARWLGFVAYFVNRDE